MAKGVNKVILVGHLGSDPEVRYTGGGTAVAKFSLATTEVYLKDGQKVEKTEWHRCTAWGKLAEICGQYLTKGKLVYIEGSLHTNSWEAQDGSGKRYATEIKIKEMQMLGSAPDRQAPADSGAPYQAPPAQGGGQQQEEDDFPF